MNEWMNVCLIANMSWLNKSWFNLPSTNTLVVDCNRWTNACCSFFDPRRLSSCNWAAIKQEVCATYGQHTSAPFATTTVKQWLITWAAEHNDIKTYRSVKRRVILSWSLNESVKWNKVYVKNFLVDLAALRQAVTRSNAERVFGGFIGKCITNAVTLSILCKQSWRNAVFSSLFEFKSCSITVSVWQAYSYYLTKFLSTCMQA